MDNTIFFSLWEHQKEGVRRALQQDSFAFYFDVGAGKSLTVITTCRARYNQHKRILKTLILCPLIVTENWRREIAKFAKKIPANRIVLPTGSGKQKAERISRNKGWDCVHILNYDALLSEDVMRALQEWGPEILVIDESQKIKSPTSKRTKAVHKLARIAKYKYLLSGSPVLQSQQDLWGQFYAMDLGRSLGDSFFKFRLKYFVDRNAAMSRGRHFPNWQVRKEMQEDLKNRVDRLSMSVKKEECLDLPPLVKQQVFVELGALQAKAYKELEKHFVAFLGADTCTAPLAITKVLRMAQVVSGHFPTDVGDVILFEDNPRVDALTELLEDLSTKHKILIWACFTQDYKIIRAVLSKLSLPYTEITGETSQAERVDAMDKFNNDYSVRCLLGNQAAAGIGVNLVSASYMIYYSRNFSLEQDLQSEARCYRAGSEIHQKITRIDIVANGTVDEAVLEALANKKQIGLDTFRYYKNACIKEDASV